MYILVKNLFFQNIMRQFFFNLDKIVFGLISRLYDLLLIIARTSPLSQGDISNMADRIYRLLAIFMLFKVTFSLIMYVVNPDDFTEKGKGVTTLLKNVVLSLAILVLTPFIFRYAYQFQEMILESNSLASLVFGDENSKKGFFNSAGESMAYTAITPFFVPDTSIDKLNNCSVLLVNGSFNPACSGLDEDLNPNESDADIDNTLYGLTEEKDRGSSLTLTDLRNYVAGVENSSMGLTFRANMALATTSDDRYIMDYSYFVSTAVGVVIVLLLVSFCMDIGVRSIKLAFLQLIAPIPIISYIDPKSGKDGLFKKWYKMCLSTFASLFVRLIVIYFAVYIISKVANHKLVDIIDGSYVTNGWVSLFILIGALMFAKQFPKILENLGIKLDGGGKFTLNPLKKISEEAMFGKQALGFGATAAAAGLAGAVNVGSRIPSSAKQLAALRMRDKDGNLTFGSVMSGIGKGVGALAKPVTSGIGGTASAAWRGSRKSIKGEKPGKVFSSSYGEAMFAKLQREDLERKGSTFWGRREADFNRITGNYNAGQRQILEMGDQDNQVAAKEYKISANKAKLARMKEEKFKPLENLQSVAKNLDDLLENDGKVKGAKAAWEAARQINDPQLAEQMRQEYKKVKAERLAKIYNDNTGSEQAHDALKQVVDLHNSIQNELETKEDYKEYRGKTKSISTTAEFKYKKGERGNYDYQYDKDGNVIGVVRVADGTGQLIIDNDNSISGVNDMGYNDDSIRYEKSIFETSGDYRKVSKEIEDDQQWIENFKASEEYVRAHDKNSAALADNAAVGTTAGQKEGWTPNPTHVDAVTYAQGSYGGNTSSFVGPGPSNPGGGPPPSGGRGPRR